MGKQNLIRIKKSRIASSRLNQGEPLIPAYNAFKKVMDPLRHFVALQPPCHSDAAIGLGAATGLGNPKAANWNHGMARHVRPLEYVLADIVGP
jgi:hypothetical protein